MIVRCPSCKTTYKVAEDLVKDSNPAFRCSRCKYTFELGSAETPEQSVDRGQSGEKLSPKTRELSFTFAPKKQGNKENQEEPIHSPGPALSKSAESRKRPQEPHRKKPHTSVSNFQRKALNKSLGAQVNQHSMNHSWQMNLTVALKLIKPSIRPKAFHLSLRHPNHFHWPEKPLATF